MKKLFVLLMVASLSTASYAQLDNQFYLRFGLSRPTKAYSGIENIPLFDVNRTGFVFELGSIFMLNSLPLGENMAIGINADYAEFVYQQIKVDNSSFPTTGIFNLSSKVGPSFSFSPVQDLVLDATLKFKINWVAVGADVYDNTDNNEVYVGAINPGFATGINVRYKFLMLSIEYNKVKAKLKNVDNDNYYRDFGSLSDKTTMAAWNIMFGFSF